MKKRKEVAYVRHLGGVGTNREEFEVREEGLSGKWG